MDTQNRGIELALFLTLPATVAFMIGAEPIIPGLFQHGAFTAAATTASAGALAAFSVGLPLRAGQGADPGLLRARGHQDAGPLRDDFGRGTVVGNVYPDPTLHHVGPPSPPRSRPRSMSACCILRSRKRGHFVTDVPVAPPSSAAAARRDPDGRGAVAGRAIGEPLPHRQPNPPRPSASPRWSRPARAVYAVAASSPAPIA